MTETQYDTSNLKNGETYYWQIESNSSDGHTAISVEGTVTGQFKVGGAFGHAFSTLIEDSSASITVTDERTYSDFYRRFFRIYPGVF